MGHATAQCNSHRQSSNSRKGNLKCGAENWGSGGLVCAIIMAICVLLSVAGQSYAQDVTTQVVFVLDGDKFGEFYLVRAYREAVKNALFPPQYPRPTGDYEAPWVDRRVIPADGSMQVSVFVVGHGGYTEIFAQPEVLDAGDLQAPVAICGDILDIEFNQGEPPGGPRFATALTAIRDEVFNNAPATVTNRIMIVMTHSSPGDGLNSLELFRQLRELSVPTRICTFYAGNCGDWTIKYWRRVSNSLDAATYTASQPEGTVHCGYADFPYPCGSFCDTPNPQHYFEQCPPESIDDVDQHGDTYPFVNILKLCDTCFCLEGFAGDNPCADYEPEPGPDIDHCRACPGELADCVEMDGQYCKYWWDACDLDCNENDVPDACDVIDDAALDCPGFPNGLIDDCEPDCDASLVADSCEIDMGTKSDCDNDGVLDVCEPDCDGDGTPDECEIATFESDDENADGVPDQCEFFCFDCNHNGILDDDVNEPGPDANGDGFLDACEPTAQEDNSFETEAGFVAAAIDGQNGWAEYGDSLSEITADTFGDMPTDPDTNAEALRIAHRGGSSEGWSLLLGPRQEGDADGEIEMWCWDMQVDGSDFGAFHVELLDLCSEPYFSFLGDVGDHVNDIANAVNTGVRFKADGSIYLRQADGQYTIAAANAPNVTQGVQSFALLVSNVAESRDVRLYWGADLQCDMVGTYPPFLLDDPNAISAERTSGGGDRQILFRTDGDFGAGNATKFWIDNFRYRQFNDCDHDGVPDTVFIDQQESVGKHFDQNGDGIPDNCQDCDRDCHGPPGLPGQPNSRFPIDPNNLECLDPEEIQDAESGEVDCNGNGIPDSCDLRIDQPYYFQEDDYWVGELGGGSADADFNLVPDECETPDHHIGPSINPPPIYNIEDSLYYPGFYNADACVDPEGGFAAPVSWQVPGDGNQTCGPEGGGCNCCWQAFAKWYYQNNLACGPGGDPFPGEAIEDAPLYVPDEAEIVHDGYIGRFPTYYAGLNAFEGAHCIQEIPLPCQATTFSPTAAARFSVYAGGQPSIDSDTASGAVFWLTAFYDPAYFDITVSGWALREDQWVYNSDELGSGDPLMFYGRGIPHPLPNNDENFRESEWRVVPDWIEVRLKAGRSLQQLGGRKVRFLAHTLNWVGDQNNCYNQCSGDAMRFEQTYSRTVGVCEGIRTNDWFVEAPALADECSASNLPDRLLQQAATEAAGVRVVNDLNVDLPSMRLGHAEVQAARTLNLTLSNQAQWLPYGGGTIVLPREGDLLLFYLFGARVALDDLPDDWSASFLSDSGNTYLRITDPCENLHYDFLAPDRESDSNNHSDEGDYPWQRAYLRRVVDGNTNTKQRVFAYENPPVGGRLIGQSDEGGQGYVSYSYDTPGDEDLSVTITGHAANGSRTMALTYYTSPDGDGTNGTRLTGASMSGDSASMSYTWGANGKLERVVDAAGRVLAAFEYDDQDNIIKKSRGADATLQTTAEYAWLNGSMMEAKFFVDATNFQPVRYDFEGSSLQPHSIELFETFNDWNSTRYITTIDQHRPGEGVHCGNLDSFYHQCCGAGLAVTRSMERTLPTIAGGDMAEYTLYSKDCRFNVVDTFMYAPGIDPQTEEVPAGAVNHIRQMWTTHGALDIDLLTERTNVPHDATTEFEYDEVTGRLNTRKEPEIDVGVMGHLWTGVNRPLRTYAYDVYGRVDLETRSGTGASQSVTIDYMYDQYGNLDAVTESDPAAQESRTTDYDYNAFGQQTLVMDADGYVTRRDYADGSGLLEKTYVFASGNGGPVIKQTNYEYEDGRIKRIKSADHDGSFTLDSPARWVVTEFEYDDYGRMKKKTVDPGGGNWSVEYEYDRQDRITKMTFRPEEIYKQITRNGRGLIVSTQIRDTADLNTLESKYFYDERGNLIERQCQGCPDCGDATKFEYDAFNRRVKEIRVEGP